MRKTTMAVVSLMIAATPILAACGNDDDSMEGHSGMGSSEEASSGAESESAGDFNDADVEFATGMIPHHEQAVEMAQLTDARAQNPEVVELAAQIEGAQAPEIETMTGWLEAWGEPVPDDMAGHDMGGSMPGMASEDELAELEGASGAEFDEMFLTLMIAHHEGAIEMAQTEQAEGANPDAIALAEDIETAQSDEIATMQNLLQ